MSVSDTDTYADEAKREPGDAGPWKAQLEKAEKAEESWRAKAEKIVKLYRNQESITSTTHRRFAMLWANTEVLRPSVYDRSPQPVVTRRFKDRDPTGREASEMLERVLSTENDLDDDDAVYREVRDEFLLVGRGVARVRYEPNFGQDEYGNETVVSEKAPLDHVYWRDFLHGPARTWKEVPWVAFRSWLSKREWRKRFGKQQDFIAGSQDEIGGDDKQRAGKAAVWEIWCRQENLVKWVSIGHEKILDEGPPHLVFDGFWPCPKPVYATLTTDNLIPTPDYRYYQDQAQEIDDLTDRIGRIQDQLKLVGFYPGGSENAGQIERALEPGFENKMVAVDSWAAFSERGGVAQIVWLPMDMVIKTLQGCIELRRQLIDDVYQITGIADIMRGDTDPNETLGAQQIKARNASIRIRSKQQEMARFTRDVQRLRTEIIAEHFQPQTLLAMSGKQLPSEQELQQQAMMAAQQAQVQAMMQQAGGTPPTPPPGLPPGQPPAPPLGAGGAPPAQTPGEPPVTIDAVMRLMREDRTRGFRIDVETDSTIVTDEMQERGEWNEMMQAVAGFLQQAIQIVQVQPQMLPVMSELLLATVRRYRVGRSSEDVIEEALNQMQEQAKAMAAQPPQPSPEEQLAQAKLQGEQMKQEGAVQKAQLDIQATQQKLQAEALKEEAKLTAEIQLQQQNHRMELEKMQAELALKTAEIELRKQELELKAQEKQMDLAAKSAQAEMDMALGSMEAMAREREINQGMVAAGQKHDLDMEAAEAKAKAAKAKPKAGK